MTNYGMYTDDGNRRVGTLINSLTVKARRGLLARGNVPLFIGGGMKRIEAKHPEVFDTVVRENITGELNKLCDEMLWTRLNYNEL